MQIQNKKVVKHATNTKKNISKCWKNFLLYTVLFDLDLCLTSKNKKNTIQSPQDIRPQEKLYLRKKIKLNYHIYRKYSKKLMLSVRRTIQNSFHYNFALGHQFHALYIYQMYIYMCDRWQIDSLTTIFYNSPMMIKYGNASRHFLNNIIFKYYTSIDND